MRFDAANFSVMFGYEHGRNIMGGGSDGLIELRCINFLWSRYLKRWPLGGGKVDGSMGTSEDGESEGDGGEGRG